MGFMPNVPVPFADLTRINSPLKDEILRRLKSGQENLDVLNWAIDVNLPMDEVLEILETLDINSRRIECLLETRLSHAG